MATKISYENYWKVNVTGDFFLDGQEWKGFYFEFYVTSDTKFKDILICAKSMFAKILDEKREFKITRITLSGHDSE